MNSLNLSDWTYQIKQIGAGLYVLQGVDNLATRWIQSERTRTYSKKTFLKQLKRSTGQPTR
jgi:hypothetical protein